MGHLMGHPHPHPPASARPIFVVGTGAARADFLGGGRVSAITGRAGIQGNGCHVFYFLVSISIELGSYSLCLPYLLSPSLPPYTFLQSPLDQGCALVEPEGVPRGTGCGFQDSVGSQSGIFSYLVCGVSRAGY